MRNLLASVMKNFNQRPGKIIGKIEFFTNKWRFKENLLYDVPFDLNFFKRGMDWKF
jgi:hypothetical protein